MSEGEVVNLLGAKALRRREGPIGRPGSSSTVAAGGSSSTGGQQPTRAGYFCCDVPQSISTSTVEGLNECHGMGLI